MEQMIKIEDGELIRALFGPADAHAKKLRAHFAVDLLSREGGIKLVGDEEAVRDAGEALQRAMHLYRRDRFLSEESWRRILEPSSEESTDRPDVVPLPRGVAPRTKGQDEYVRAMAHNDISFAVGPAGTGKTFLAAAVAVAHLKAGDYRKIVLCRPAVEAGEHLGFLPGDFQAKVNPYLRPLYDALFNLLDVGQVRRYIDGDVIEVAPLAYMRGRTLERSFVILDEAQNTTPGQMKMFLTRMGRESKVVVTGDPTQVDLPDGVESGLAEATDMLESVDGIAICRLKRADIVRHHLVQRIVDAYEKSGTRHSGPSSTRG